LRGHAEAPDRRERAARSAILNPLILPRRRWNNEDHRIEIGCQIDFSKYSGRTAADCRAKLFRERTAGRRRRKYFEAMEQQHRGFTTTPADGGKLRKGSRVHCELSCCRGSAVKEKNLR